MNAQSARTIIPPMALLTALALPTPSRADAERFEIDPVHSRVLIRVWHAGYSRAMATLSAPSGEIHYDAQQPERSRVSVELALDRLDFGDAEWNARMAKPDYFDSAAHPIARYDSERVEDLGEGRLRVHGRLSLRGEQVPVSLEARINRTGARLPFVPRDSVGASATALLDRQDFGMRKHAGTVGDAVEVWIEVEARRARADRGRNERSRAERERDRDRRSGTASADSSATSDRN